MSDRRLPDLVIIGAPRAGTTSLYHILDRIDGVCMSSIKEPRFFEREVGEGPFATRPVTDEQEYLSLWSHCEPHQLRGEGSPVYLFDPGTPDAIAERIPDAKLVVSVRNPVDRAISHYYYRERRTGRSDRTLRETIEASRTATVANYEDSYLLIPGFYARHMRRWMSSFTRDQIHVVIFEEMASDPVPVVADLCDFLGVEPPADIDLTHREANAASEPRSGLARFIIHSPSLRRMVRLIGVDQAARRWGERMLTTAVDVRPEVDSADVEALTEIYRDDVADLKALLGRDLPWA